MFTESMLPEGILSPLYSLIWWANAQDFRGTDDAKSDVVDRSSVSLVDHEERRMPDLSDIWSVVSSVDNHVNEDNQLSSLAAEQELYNIQKECEEKDAIIKELTTSSQTSSTVDAKRIAELQDIFSKGKTW